MLDDGLSEHSPGFVSGIFLSFSPYVVCLIDGRQLFHVGYCVICFYIPCIA